MTWISFYAYLQKKKQQATKNEKKINKVGKVKKKLRDAAVGQIITAHAADGTFPRAAWRKARPSKR